MIEAVRELLDGYQAIVSLPVQWGDMDALGHVNNVIFFRWLESSRVALLTSLADISPTKSTGVGPILASAKCDYRRQLQFPDHIHIGSRIDRVGNSSIRIVQRIVSDQQKAVVAEGEAILVLFDYLQSKSVPIPDEVRAVLLTDTTADG